MPTNTDGVQGQPVSTEQDSMQRLAEIRERAEKAAPGPWSLLPLNGKYYGTDISIQRRGMGWGGADERPMTVNVWGYRHGALSVRERKSWPPDETEFEDAMSDGHYEDEGDFSLASFIAHSREDVPYLISLIDSLTAERDRLRTGVDVFIRETNEAAARWAFTDAGSTEDLYLLTRSTIARAEAAEAEVKRLREALDGAYRERAQMAVALARMFPSWVNIDPDEPDWPVLYVQLPTGQASWHFSPADRSLLDGITVGGPAWDGHTTEEKYARLAALESLGGRKDG